MQLNVITVLRIDMKVFQAHSLQGGKQRKLQKWRHMWKEHVA